jgi:hypothetical protein
MQKSDRETVAEVIAGLDLPLSRKRSLAERFADRFEGKGFDRDGFLRLAAGRVDLVNPYEKPIPSVDEQHPIERRDVDVTAARVPA